MKRRTGRIFFVHVLREIVLAVFAVSFVLLLLLVTNQVASVLRRAAEGEIPASVVLELARLSVGENSVIILPIALLIGILLALGRLYHDSELAAAQACGMGRRQLYGPAMLVAAGAALVCGWIAFSAGPAAAKRIYDIRTDALRTAMTRGLTAGQFRSLGGGAVLYFRERDEAGLLREVFFQRPVADSKVEGSVEVMLAKTANYTLSADGGTYTVVLNDGKRHEGVPGQGAWRTLAFTRLTVPITVPEATLRRSRADMLTTGELLKDPTPRNLSELHWRIATIIITLVLGVLAVPLSKLRPRQGRYARVGWGVLIYALYANLLIAGRTMIEQERMPGWLGLWWVHVLVAAAVVLAMNAPRLLHRLRVSRLRSAQPA